MSTHGRDRDARPDRVHQPESADILDLDAARTRRDATDPIDLSDDSAPVPVDHADTQRPERINLTALRASQRRPIVPRWLRSTREFAALTRWWLGFAAHTSAYHLTRSPKYAARILARSPRGLARVVRGFFRWVFDLEGEPVRQAIVRAAVSDPHEARTYQSLSRQRDRRVRWRGLVALTATLTLLAATGLLAVADPTVRWSTIAGLLAVFGLVGRPADRPLLDTAVVVPRVAKLTSDVVVRALGCLGIAGINQALAKNPKAIGFPAPITRDGPGWRSDVELPFGVTATKVIERREELAAALGRPLGCVWPMGDAEVHPGRLVLWVGDEDLAKAKSPVWPLLKSGTVSLFAPIPFGTDQRGRLVEVTLMFASMVIGSVPRVGKTFAARLLLLAGGLDPLAELHAYDLKGMGDFSSLAMISHRYRAGSDDEDIAYGLADMRELAKELNRRTKVIRELPRDVCPENKVTPELAARKSLRLHPILVVVDECQRWFEHAQDGEELASIAEDLVRRGPAAGIIAVFATQRPDSKSLPTGISGNAILRFCLRVMGQVENDMVLGTSAYRNGIRATMFARKDLGIGYLLGEGDDPQITRTFYIDNPTAEQIATRARALREAAGTLSGHALGEQPTTAQVASVSLLDDLIAVVPASEAKVWNETAVARLAELRPEVYSGWETEQLTAALKPFKVRIGQVWGTDPATGKGANRRGFERAHIMAAITERNRKRNAG